MKKKFVAFGLLFFVLSLLSSSSVFAQVQYKYLSPNDPRHYSKYAVRYEAACVDHDNDGYYLYFGDTLTHTRNEFIALWKKVGGGVDETKAKEYYTKMNVIANCQTRHGYKGVESGICDEAYIKINHQDAVTPKVITPELAGTLYDPAKYLYTEFEGKDFNPGKVDTPGDGIDQNCDGVDAGYTDVKTDVKIGDYVDLIAAILRSLVAGIGTTVIVWSGILYASSAGDENKISKAKKAFFYGVVGIAIGFIAPYLISMIAGYVL